MLLHFTPFWWIGKDSLGIVALGIAYDVAYCYNLGKEHNRNNRLASTCPLSNLSPV